MSSVRFRCPHCGESLAADERTLACPMGHTFDRAREGYVNLLVGGRLPGGPRGDDDTMVRSRRAVFDAGCYDPIIDAVASAVARSGARVVLDAGCGEGTYLARSCDTFAEGWGIDISKDAVRLAARRHAGLSFAVASSYRLPFADGTFDAVINVFAPREFDEMMRVLVPGGAAIVVSPGPDHLVQLRELIYDTPRPHDEEAGTPVPESVESVQFTVVLDDSTLRRQLLEMTPYWWSANAERRAEVEAALVRVDADMVLAVYRR